MRMRGYVQWIVVAVSSLAALALLGLCAFTFLYLRQQGHAAAAFAAPTVFVTEPASGASIPVGDYLSVSATASGSIPIARVELWLDGELKETQGSDQPQGAPTFYAYFDLPISEGPHMLFVRAVNTGGIIGQSLPVGVTGVPKIASSDVFLAVTVEEGETLADIATAYDTEPEVLQDLNPDLGGQEPAAGSRVQVPNPPDQGEEPAPSGPPPSPPGSAPIPIPPVPPLTEVKGFPILDLVAQLIAFAGSIPPAPTDLKGQVDGCDVILTWNDNSTDETHYDVWMSLGMLMPQVVASLQPSPGTGAAWVKFFPGQEGYLTFWVEAVNSNGKQPSNEITLLIPQNVGCGTVTTDYLQIQVFDMTVQGNYDRVYCYASYEGAPEQRIPATAGDFVQVSAGKADFSEKAAGLNSRMVPVPTDGALNIEGKCLGWSGQTLNDLGPFSGTFTQYDWDGVRRTLKSTSYEIEFAVKPYTVGVWPTLGVAAGMYGYEDPTLPAPYDVSIGKVYSPWANVDPRERALVWKWSGDPSKIKGFSVFLDGIPYGYVDGANTRQATVYNPNQCGKSFLWQVRAVAGPTQSPLSPLFYDKLPACKSYVMVKFNWISLLWSSDGLFGGDCDTLSAYYSIRVNDEVQAFWGPPYWTGGSTIFTAHPVGTSMISLKCGVRYYFSGMGYGPHPDEIVVPVEAEPFEILISTRFRDYDEWSGDDAFGEHSARLWYSSLQDAQQDLGCGKSFTTDRARTDTATSVLNYSVFVYPNACEDVPPHLPSE
jgi:hypothetical protein